MRVSADESTGEKWQLSDELEVVEVKRAHDPLYSLYGAFLRPLNCSNLILLVQVYSTHRHT